MINFGFMPQINRIIKLLGSILDFSQWKNNKDTTLFMLFMDSKIISTSLFDYCSTPSY